MFYVYFDAVFLMYVLCQMLGRIYTSVLSASTSEREHQTCKSSLYISLHVCIGKLIDALQKSEYLAVIFKKSYHRLV